MIIYFTKRTKAENIREGDLIGDLPSLTMKTIIKIDINYIPNPDFK